MIGHSGFPAEERRALEREVAHWKANHKCEVERARVLKERTDMPLERVKAYEQIGRLQEQVRGLEETYRRDLKMHEELYILRRTVYRIGKQLKGDVFEEEDIIRIGKELIAESGLCTACDGTGEDGDPDGGTYACDFCKGSGRSV